MKQSIVKDLTTQEIREKIAEEKKQLAKLKLNHTVSPVENPMKIRFTRRTIARLSTELSRRLAGEAKQ